MATQAQDVTDPQVTAEILPGWRTAQGTQMAALKLTLPDGWHTYWRSPGEAGIPPRFDWSGSDNVSAVTPHWPAPDVFDLNGYRTLGYLNALTLPIEFTPASGGGPMHVTAKLDIGVCDEVCVPVSLEVSANLPEQSRRDTVISAALAAVPADAQVAGVKAAVCSVEPLKDGLRVTTHVTLPPQGQNEFAVVEAASPDVWVQTVSSGRNKGILTTVVDMVPPNAQPFLLDRSSVVITVFGGPVPVEVKGCTG